MLNEIKKGKMQWPKAIDFTIATMDSEDWNPCKGEGRERKH